MSQPQAQDSIENPNPCECDGVDCQPGIGVAVCSWCKQKRHITWIAKAGKTFCRPCQVGPDASKVLEYGLAVNGVAGPGRN